MTESDFAKIKFRMVLHLNAQSAHICTYASVGHDPAILICVRTLVKEDGSYGRVCRRYRVRGGGVYKTKKKFLDAMTAYEEECKLKLE